MSKIECNQMNCKYNNHEHCMKNGINVSKNAVCDSYEKDNSGKTSKFEFASFESLENNISCDAATCIYNKNQSCTVNHLNIGKSKNGAPCIDFEKRV